MKKKAQLLISFITFIGVFLLAPTHCTAEPAKNFQEAKRLLRDYVYHDQAKQLPGTIYCGCDWKWTTRTGGKPDLKSCGYEPRSDKKRAQRTEYEHILSMKAAAQQRQCWKDGGRKNCKATDPVFNLMEADLHGLAISIGEINNDRSSYRYGVVQDKTLMYGECTSRTDFKQRIFEPRDEVKGFAARTTFYMYDRYDLRLSRQQQQLLMAWDKMYPPADWELERNRRIERITGVSNDFITGERTWTMNHSNGSSALSSVVSSNEDPNTPEKNYYQPKAISGSIKGNKNSKIYHLPNSCPSYDKVSDRNAVYFNSESEAIENNYRKAKNCKAL